MISYSIIKKNLEVAHDTNLVYGMMKGNAEQKGK